MFRPCTLKGLNRAWSYNNGCIPWSFTEKSRSTLASQAELRPEYDVAIIGAGHNGLVAASYLQRSGLDVCVLERRHLVGGAAVTEELVPGFKFSRASYLLSLMRPQIINDLELKKHGLKIYLRDPNSYTPLLNPKGNARSLILGRNEAKNHQQISQFSKRDAEAFPKYESMLSSIVDALEPLLDTVPPNIATWGQKSLREKLKIISSSRPLINSMRNLGSDMTEFYEMMTAPAEKVLNKWFESEPLKSTLATDSVIGAMISPKLPGSGYVLLHHVMGELEGIKGAWGYVEGGMGAVSDAIASSAEAHGASIFTDKKVSQVLVSGGRATGLGLEDGTEVRAKYILSNATARVTYMDLIDQNDLSTDFLNGISNMDFTSPVTKINIACSRIPNFVADPVSDNRTGPQHVGTIHLGCEDMPAIHAAYTDAQNGQWSKLPVIEMTIPSSLDPTVAPPGAHVVQLFTQYTPFTLAGDQAWDEETRNKYADHVFDIIEQYAPGFKESVIGRDILTPPDLERIFGLTGGNIFHGSMSLDQLFFSRPLPQYCDFQTPIKGLYMCGSSVHPGGGVMGSPGRLAAMKVLQDKENKK